VDWTPEVNTHNPLEIKQMLLDGEPRVAVSTSTKSIVINPQMLKPGEELIVAECIRNVIANG
jgi:hypothetical protein